MFVAPGYRVLSLKPRRDEKSVEVVGEALSGGLPERGESILFPGARRVRIKSTEFRNRRVELAVKGAPRSALKTGAVLAAVDWPLSECREALLLADGKPVPTRAEAVQGGPTPDFNKERLIGPARFRREGSFIRVRFPSPYPLMPAADLSILDADGRPRRLTVLFPGRPDSSLMRRLNATARRRPNPHPGPGEIFSRLLELNGFIRLPPPVRLPVEGKVEPVGEWILLPERRRKIERELVKLTSRPGGADIDLLRIDGVPDGLILAMAIDMAERGVVIDRKGWFFPPGDPPLSPFHRSWLSRVEAADAEGIRIRTIASPADREALQALGRSDLICGGEELWLSMKAVAGAATKIRERYPSGERVVMADIRELIGGSRAFTIELLAVLDAEGVFEIRSDGITRLVS